MERKEPVMYIGSTRAPQDRRAELYSHQFREIILFQMNKREKRAALEICTYIKS